MVTCSKRQRNPCSNDCLCDNLKASLNSTKFSLYNKQTHISLATRSRNFSAFSLLSPSPAQAPASPAAFTYAVSSSLSLLSVWLRCSLSVRLSNLTSLSAWPRANVHRLSPLGRPHRPHVRQVIQRCQQHTLRHHNGRRGHERHDKLPFPSDNGAAVAVAVSVTFHCFFVGPKARYPISTSSSTWRCLRNAVWTNQGNRSIWPRYR